MQEFSTVRRRSAGHEALAVQRYPNQIARHAHGSERQKPDSNEGSDAANRILRDLFRFGWILLHALRLKNGILGRILSRVKLGGTKRNRNGRISGFSVLDPSH